MSEGEPGRTIERLAAMPAWLRHALSRLGAVHAEQRPAAGAWSLADVVRHVRASDAIVATRVWHILAREGAPLPAFDERVWGQLLAAAALPLSDQVESFALRRAELVGVLRSFGDEQWSAAGEHELTGRVTIAGICASVVEHEAEHQSQTKELMEALLRYPRSYLTRPPAHPYDRPVIEESPGG